MIFSYLLYADGIKKGKQAPFVGELKSIPALQLTKHQLESLHPEDRPKMELIVRKTKPGVKALSVFEDLDGWIRRWLRWFSVKQRINNPPTRYRNLIQVV